MILVLSARLGGPLWGSKDPSRAHSVSVRSPRAIQIPTSARRKRGADFQREPSNTLQHPIIEDDGATVIHPHREFP
jgi:hypothetical protein